MNWRFPLRLNEFFGRIGFGHEQWALMDHVYSRNVCAMCVFHYSHDITTKQNLCSEKKNKNDAIAFQWDAAIH